MKLIKYEGNPILCANPENTWESLVSTNPGAWYDEGENEIKLFYRAAGDDFEHRIQIGLAVSKDGFNFTRVSDKPLISTSEDNWDAGSIEDPRVVKFGDYYFITYPSVSVLPGRYWENNCRFLPEGLPEEAPLILRENQTRTGLIISKDLKKFYRLGYITDPTVDDRDVMIFPEKVNGKFVTLHRPMQWVGKEYGCESPSMWIAFSDDLLEHKNLILLAKAKYDWEVKIGGSAPPIKTEHGWLTLYHAVGTDNKYRVGAMMLDLNNPSKVLYRSPEPVMVPEYNYENVGIYKGICFPCGNIVKDGMLFVYYGGADQYVGVATCKLDDIVNYLLSCPV